MATALIVTSAFAADLAPGKPAGVKKAQNEEPSTLMIVAGVGIVGLGIGLAVSGGSAAPAVAPPVVISSSTTT